MMVTFTRVSSWCQIEFLGAPRRIGLPAAAGGTAPVELAGLEAAGFAAIARKPPRMPVHKVAHEFEVPALVGRARGDDLRFEQSVKTEQGWISSQLVAYQGVRLLGTFCLERLLKHGVEEV